MNEKLTLQELSELLAKRHQMEQADADAFVRTFFALVEEALAADKYVKVKGLGTFKLIDVDAREGVDVNSGERIEIQSHSRISFTPDASMRDGVNRPFSHFETVLLNESTHFDDMVEETETLTSGDDAAQDAVVPDQEFQPVQTLQEAESPAEEKPAPAPLPVGTNAEKDTSRRKYRLPWCFIASILLIGILIGGVIVWVMLSGRQYIPESVVRTLTEEKTSQPGGQLPAVRTDTVAPPAKYEPIVLPALSGQSTDKSSQRTPPVYLSDTIRYTIAGTLTTHTLRRGESLARLAQRFYGNKNLWPYLARHNRDVLKDANDIPVGTLIRIPKLEPRK